MKKLILTILALIILAYITPNLSNYKTEINAAMTTLGSSYQLTTVDLSGFPTY